jgi:hypothetical protein
MGIHEDVVSDNPSTRLNAANLLLCKKTELSHLERKCRREGGRIAVGISIGGGIEKKYLLDPLEAAKIEHYMEGAKWRTDHR